MIFAAGMGTRLKPLTDTMPKALVPVGGQPLLKRVINNLMQAGAGNIVVNVHHFAQMIVDCLEQNHCFGANVRVSDESSKLLDTGGGIKKARHLFSPDENILIHNVDILSNVDLAQFYAQAMGNEATLLVSRRNTKRYLLFDDDMRLVGWTNIDTGEVRGPYPGLDPHSCNKLAFAGIHVLSPKLFPLMDAFPDKFGIIDFYLKVCHKVSIKGVCMPNLQLMDVGKLDTLAAADSFVKGL